MIEIVFGAVTALFCIIPQDIRAFFSPPGGKAKPKSTTTRKDQDKPSTTSNLNGNRNKGKNKSDPKTRKVRYGE